MTRRPRGTRDFAADEMANRNEAAAKLRSAFTQYGYREIQTPTFEELELFTAKSGDGIISELYDFTDKGGRRMTLRPELTAPVMRMYFADHAFDPKPVKWFYHGSCFRYDRPQEGRYREFWQFGCEQIGAGTPLAYAELIALGDSLFDAVGLAERRLSVGHVQILRTAVEAIGLDDEARGAAMRAIDKKDHDGFSAACEGADAAAISRVHDLMAAGDMAAVRTAMAGLDLDDALDEIEAVMGHLATFGVDAVLDLGIARGLDYYTGIVFEAHSDVLGAQSQLLGGGGYDLAHVFGAKSTPTMGFGLGFDRTLVALEKAGVQPASRIGPHVYLAALGSDAVAVVVGMAAELRRRGARVELDLLGRKTGPIAKAADAAGARYLLVLGDRDLESGTARLKHLVDGESKEVAIPACVDVILESCGIVDLKDYD